MSKLLLALGLLIALPALGSASPAWFAYESRPGFLFLYEGDRLIGQYDLASHVYRPLVNRVPQDPCEPPVPPPHAGRSLPDETTNYGVLSGQVIPGYRSGGVQAGDGVLNDGSNVRLTIFAPLDRGGQIQSEIAALPEFQAVASRLTVQVIPPDHWAARCGFQTSPAHPTIYIQNPDGRVLHRQDDWTGAPALFAALRRVRPDYQPTNDPDGRISSVDLMKLFANPIVLAGLGLLALIVLIPSRKVA